VGLAATGVVPFLASHGIFLCHQIIWAVDDLFIDVQNRGNATIAPPEGRQMYFSM
jgi:hypothetical protein